MQEYDLNRFKKAQELDYQAALKEVRQGRKRSHWIWYIFPQVKGLGHSRMSDYYGLDGLAEAKAYLSDPILGKRLIEISQALLDLNTSDASAVFQDSTFTVRRAYESESKRRKTTRWISITGNL